MFLSVQFSCSVVFDFLQPHELQHARPPCPLPTPGVYSKLTSIELVMPSNHLILCRPLLLLPLIRPSIRVFPSESALSVNLVPNTVLLSPHPHEQMTVFLQDLQLTVFLG